MLTREHSESKERKMKLYIDKELEERIVQYVNGKLSQPEIDKLWSDLITDGHYIEYLKTIASLQRTGNKREPEYTSAFRKSGQPLESIEYEEN